MSGAALATATYPAFANLRNRRLERSSHSLLAAFKPALALLFTVVINSSAAAEEALEQGVSAVASMEPKPEALQHRCTASHAFLSWSEWFACTGWPQRQLSPVTECATDPIDAANSVTWYLWLSAQAAATACNRATRSREEAMVQREAAATARAEVAEVTILCCLALTTSVVALFFRRQRSLQLTADCMRERHVRERARRRWFAACTATMSRLCKQRTLALAAHRGTSNRREEVQRRRCQEMDEQMATQLAAYHEKSQQHARERARRRWLLVFGAAMKTCLFKQRVLTLTVHLTAVHREETRRRRDKARRRWLAIGPALIRAAAGFTPELAASLEGDSATVAELPCPPDMLQIFGCQGELSQLNGLYEKKATSGVPGELPEYVHRVLPYITLKHTNSGSAPANVPGQWTIWKDAVQLLVAHSPSPLPLDVAWDQLVEGERHPLARVRCSRVPDPHSTPVRFESCVAESGRDVAADCLRDDRRTIYVSGSGTSTSTAITPPLGHDDWTLKFAVRVHDRKESLPMIGVVMSDVVDFSSLETELAARASGSSPLSASATEDFVWFGAQYIHDDGRAWNEDPHKRHMWPITSSTFFQGYPNQVLSWSDAFCAVDLQDNTDFLLTLRWTRTAGVRIRFGEDEQWRMLPGRFEGGFAIQRFNKKVETTGLVRAFVRLNPQSGASVRLLSSTGDLHALKQSLRLAPPDLSKMFCAYHEARCLGASGAEIQEVLESNTDTRGDIDGETVTVALSRAIRDAVEKEAALKAFRRAAVCARIREHADTYAKLALPADWKGMFAGRTGYAAFRCGDDEGFFRRFLAIGDKDPRRGLGRDAMDRDDSGNSFEFVAAWRIENPELWRTYQASLQNMLCSMQRMLNDGDIQEKSTSTEIGGVFHGYNWQPPLESIINEMVLCHGTSPTNLDAILTNGLNPKYTGRGNYGHGVYFAGNPIKNDQYTSPPDASYQQQPHELAALHEMLYRGGESEHPGDVRYFIICRVLMGHFIRTDGAEENVTDLTDMDSPGCSVWDPGLPAIAATTELAKIPGTRANYHSLVVDKTGADKFTEFVQFHGNRVYPAYVVAYKNVWQ